jgi:hypothetical protein
MDISKITLIWPVWLVLLVVPNVYLQAIIVCNVVITISYLTILVLMPVQLSITGTVHLWSACHASSLAIAVSILVTA